MEGSGKVGFNQEVSVGHDSIRGRVVGKQVSIGQKASIGLLYGGERADIDHYSEVGVLVSLTVKTGQEVFIKEAAVREADFGADSEFGSVIVLSGGNVTFRSEIYVKDLVIGPNIDHITIGNYCDVKRLRSVGNPSITMGIDSKINNESLISPEEYQEILHETLRKFGPEQEL